MRRAPAEAPTSLTFLQAMTTEPMAGVGLVSHNIAYKTQTNSNLTNLVEGVIGVLVVSASAASLPAAPN